MKPQKKIDFNPGQIIFAGLNGFGEGPFAICSNPDNKNIEICVRKVGRLTSQLHKLKTGDYIELRGPIGNGWPSFAKASEGKPIDQNYIFIVGGLGLLPLRSLILSAKNKIQIFYGAKNPNEFLFKDEFDKWKKSGIDLQLTIDKPSPDWNGSVGVVTALFDQHEVIENALAFLCGPPIMFKFVTQKLKDKNFPTKDIYMSLERRMHCGIGVCQHCAVGHKYVCKDGPVFNYEELRNIPDVF